MDKGRGGGTVVDEALDATVLDPLTADAPLARGASLGRYLVLELLGAGGMGVVYAAYDPELDRKVAVKLLRGDGGEGSSGRTRLLREAQAMARLADPNVIHVYDVGTINDQVFVAMELVDGMTLRRWVAQRGPDEILAMFVQAGRGLAAAHAAGLVHRDFKPDNVLVGADGRARVLDFGLARVAQEPPAEQARRAANPTALTTPLTRTGAFLGTPAYMAPEQLAGGPVDAACDQFAFCVALYEALYGERPFGGESIDALTENIRSGRVREPPADRAVPPALRRALLRGLEVEAAVRHPTIAALLEALSPTTTALQRKTEARRRRLAAVAVTILAALMALGGWMQTRRSATARVKRAQELGQEVQKIRSLMRAAHLLPLHDIKPDRDHVRAQMKRIEAQMRELGDEGRGPGEFALGSSHFSIGDRPEARKHLELAWAAGERNPDLAYELGLVLAKEYERATLDTPPLDADKMKLRDRELKEKLHDPALAYLRQAGGATDTSPAYVEALIAFYDQRKDDARARAETAFRETPTLYEAGLLVANVDSRLAIEAMGSGDKAAAKAHFARAEAMYRRVVEIGRSDDETYRMYSDYLGGETYEHFRIGEDVTAGFERVLELCAEGRRADSEKLWPDEYAAKIEWAMGENDSAQHRDPRPRFLQAIATGEHVLEKDPRSAKALLAIGNTWGSMVDDWEAPRGLDPRASLHKAIAAFEAMLAITPDIDAFANLGNARWSLARWQWTHGLDAAATVDAGMRNLEDALRADPVHADIAYSSECVMLCEFARSRLEAGIDPAPLLQRAEPPCVTGRHRLEGQPGAPDGLGQLLDGQARLAWATGGDPLPLWQRAQTEFEAMVKLDAHDQDLRAELVVLLAGRARYETAQRLSATQDVERALAEGRAAARTSPQSATVQRALAAATLAAAYSRTDPAALLIEGLQAIDRALAIKADDLQAMLIGAELRLLQAGLRTPLVSPARAIAVSPARAIADGQALVARGLAINPGHARLLALRSRLERLAGDSAHADADRAAALAAGPLLQSDPLLAR